MNVKVAVYFESEADFIAGKPLCAFRNAHSQADARIPIPLTGRLVTRALSRKGTHPVSYVPGRPYVCHVTLGLETSRSA